MSTVDFGGARWRKSSRSAGGGDQDNCVELAYVDSLAGVRDSKNPNGPMLTFPQAVLQGARWRKSSQSSGGGAEACVELAYVDSLAGVRDSKNPNGPALMIPREGLSGLLHLVAQ
jgi:hypothetical protein